MRQGFVCLGILAAVATAPNAIAQEYAQLYPAYPAPGYDPHLPPPGHAPGPYLNGRVIP